MLVAATDFPVGEQPAARILVMDAANGRPDIVDPAYAGDDVEFCTLLFLRSHIYLFIMSKGRRKRLATYPPITKTVKQGESYEH